MTMRVSCCFIVAAIVGQAEIISRIDNNQSSKRGPSNWSVAAPTTLKSPLINEVTTKWRQKKMFSNNVPTASQSIEPISFKFSEISTFNHPGALVSKTQLDYIKNQIIAERQPWFGEYQMILNSPAASAVPRALKTVLSTVDSQANTIRDDAFAAYTQALLWYISENDVYAQRSKAILNAWSSLTGFVSGTDQDKLLAGWIGAVFAPAAEILRLY